MVKEPRRIAYDEFAAHLKAVFDRLIAEEEAVVIEKEGHDLAVLRPVRRAARKPSLKGRRTSADDPFWNIAGAAAGPDDGATDVSANKHKYLSDAYADQHK